MAIEAGVIGLGIMGGAIAANIARAGIPVRGFDVDTAARERFAASGGRPCSGPEAVAAGADIVVCSLPSAGALDTVARAIAGSGTAAGTIVLECSTLPIADKIAARDLMMAGGAILLDCPLSGTGAQAVNGDLVLFGSGDEAAFTRAAPVIQGFTRGAKYVGAFGNGSRMKFIANLLVAVHNVAAAEAMVLGMKAGLDPQLVFETLAESAATSRMFQVRGPSMVADCYPPMIRADLFDKDLRIIGDFADEISCPTPLFAATRPIYSDLLAEGMGGEDTAAVCRVLERRAAFERHAASDPLP